MTCFLYYLPGVDAPITADRLRSLGLGYALAGAKHPGAGLACAAVHRGPDGGQGQVVAAADRLGDSGCIGFYPDKQTWRKIPAACLPLAGDQAVWAGFYTAKPPGPDDLLRADALRGESVALADGRPWIVPIVRGITVDPTDPAEEARLTTAVPTVAGITDDGHWQAGQIAPAYRAAWQAALRWSEAKAAIEFGVGDASGVIDFDGILDAAVDVLAVNYALAAIEVDMLGLFTTHHPRQVLDAAIDWKALGQWFKKKLSANHAGGDSSVGCEGSTPPTGQLAASG